MTSESEPQRLLESVAKSMRLSYEKSAGVQHRGGKGQIRESAIQDYLTKWMPASIQVTGRGEAVAIDDSRSPECDVMFLDPSTPPWIHEDGYRVAPIECVHGVLQVKSGLDRRALAEDLRKISTAKAMGKTAYKPQAGPIRQSSSLYGKSWSYFPLWGAAFGYHSASLETLLDEVLKHDATVPLSQQVDAIFSLQRGAVVPVTAEGQIAASAQPGGQRWAIKSDNPLLLMTVLMQDLMQQAWMPRFDLLAYVYRAGFGHRIAFGPTAGAARTTSRMSGDALKG